MTISFQKYVDITSGVAGSTQAAQRELIGRLFTGNELLPTKSFVEFTDVDSVGSYFGVNSDEYLRAQFYFGWVSKLTTTPQKISFARWANTDTAPQIFGAQDDYLLSSFTAISDGAFSLTIGPDVEIITGLDFTTALSLADVATTISAAIQAANIAAVWTASTTLYDVTGKRFTFNGGAAGVNAISVANAGSGTEIAALIGWLNTGVILSDGVAEETVTEVLTESSNASNNFGSFLFIPALSLPEISEAAQWVAAENVKFQFYHAVLEVDAQATFDEVKDLGGTGIMIRSDSVSNEYPEMMPMNILAATDYNRRNANQNYMFQQFAITPTVTETLDSDSLDSIRMNYYGETQQAGRSLQFFQRGVLMGIATDPLDMNTYANEQWLKDAVGVSVMNLLLAVSAVPANDTGRSQVLGAIQPNIEQAKFNGVISVGKPLTPTQQATISQITGDDNAWRQVQNIGYWIDAIVSEDNQNPGNFLITYLLVYAKGDAVRKVEGTHTLI